MHLSLALSNNISEGPGEIFLLKARSLRLFLGRLQAFSQGSFSRTQCAAVPAARNPIESSNSMSVLGMVVLVRGPIRMSSSRYYGAGETRVRRNSHIRTFPHYHSHFPARTLLGLVRT
jgi:hypothetical protein